jgi:hypothetical protein
VEKRMRKNDADADVAAGMKYEVLSMKGKVKVRLN